MGIKYSLTKLKNPRRPIDPLMYYAKAQAREIITLRKISEEVAWGSTLTPGDVENIFLSLAERSAYHLREGSMVDWGALGKLQFQLSSEGALTREEFTHRNIKKLRFCFRPGMLFKNGLKDLSFERVLSLKSKKEALRKEAE